MLIDGGPVNFFVPCSREINMWSPVELHCPSAQRGLLPAAVIAALEQHAHYHIVDDRKISNHQCDSSPNGAASTFALLDDCCATYIGARVFHRIDGRFDKCSFRKIGTDNCSLVGTFTDCDFSETSFRNSHLLANFIRCKFHDCNMKVASWGSSFEDCEFAGAKIDEVFGDVRDVAFSADVVTFVVLSGKVHVGETRHIS